MKKLILSITLVCFIGAAKIYAQSADAKATTPATSAATIDAANPTVVTQSGNQSVETPGDVKTTTKAESKKSTCSHSAKACCMSKDAASKKECKDKHSEKAEAKPENTEIKNN